MLHLAVTRKPRLGLFARVIRWPRLARLESTTGYFAPDMLYSGAALCPVWVQTV